MLPIKTRPRGKAHRRGLGKFVRVTDGETAGVLAEVGVLEGRGWIRLDEAIDERHRCLLSQSPARTLPVTAYNVLYTDSSATRYSDADESIWHEKIYWDDETDDYTYTTFYDQVNKGDAKPGYLPAYSEIFRVWHAFCYSQPDPFGATASAP